MPTALKIILYPVFAFLSLVVFTVALFPFDSVKNRVSTEMEIALGGQYAISIGQLSPSPLMGAVLKDLEIRRRGGSGPPVKLSKVSLKFSLLPLLSGFVEVDFDLRAERGHALGSVSSKKGGIALALKMDRLDLALADFVLQEFNIPLSGIVNGTVNIEIYAQDPLRNTGKVKLEIPDLKLGEINIAEGLLQIPALRLAQAGEVSSKIDLEVKKGNIEVKALQFLGGDIDLKADGKVYGAKRMENYRFNLKGNLKVSQEVADKIPLLLAVEKQKAADGSYPLTITGRITKPSIRIGDFKLPI